jgi:hypothetical protein
MYIRHSYSWETNNDAIFPCVLTITHAIVLWLSLLALTIFFCIDGNLVKSLDDTGVQEIYIDKTLVISTIYSFYVICFIALVGCCCCDDNTIRHVLCFPDHQIFENDRSLFKCLFKFELIATRNSGDNDLTLLSLLHILSCLLLVCCHMIWTRCTCALEN